MLPSHDLSEPASIGVEIGRRIDCLHGCARRGREQSPTRGETLDLRFDRLQTEYTIANITEAEPDITEAEPDISARVVFQRQHGGSGRQREIAFPLTDFLKRPAVTLQRDILRSGGPIAVGTPFKHG